MRLPLEIGKSRGIDVRITEGHAGGRISGGMAAALQDIYLQTLERCRPEKLVHVPDDAPRDVVAIGKCAAALFRGVRDYRDALVIVPEGYPRVDDVECIDGGHPDLTPASFAAGKRLLEFVEQHDDILFLISGGGSACVEWPLPGYTQDQLTKINHDLVASGRPIGEINAERRKYSAIKGGRLGARVRGRCMALIYSDVSTGRLADVASGPVTRNMQLIADNHTLVKTAASVIPSVVEGPGGTGGAPHTHTGPSTTLGMTTVWDEQIECDVQTAAEQLAKAARNLKKGEVLVAGGEPTVEHKGDGKGGRCCELAARFALQEINDVEALFGSSDGVDGNSGIAAALLPPNPPVDRHKIESELRNANSLAVVEMLGRAIMIPPTGNNLRDLVLLARA